MKLSTPPSPPPTSPRSLRRTALAGLGAVLALSGGALTAAGAPPAVSFTTSRSVDCAAPCAVFFDARATRDADLSDVKSFHSLLYSWDFGDPEAGTWPYSPTQQSRNVDYGPVAGHVYDRAGTYTVQLTVSDGDSPVVQSRQVVVSEPDAVWPGSATVCVSNDGDHAGCPSGAKKVSFNSDFDQALKASTACNAGASSVSVRCLFKRGDTFNASAPIVLASPGPSLIGSYGSGSKPVVFQNASHDLFQDGSRTEDWRVMDLDLRGPDDISKVIDLTAAKTGPKRILIYRVDSTGYGAVMRSQVFGKVIGTDEPKEVAVVDSTSDAHPYDGGGKTLGTRWFGGGSKILLLGNKLVDQKPGDPAHLVRILWMDGGVLAHNLLGDGQAGGNVIKLHNESALDDPPCTRDIVIADNEFRNWTPHQMATFGPQSGSSTGNGECVERLIIERNHVKNTYARSTGIGMQLRVMSRDTMIRNNVFDLTPHGHGGGLGVTIDLWNTDPSTPRPKNNYVLNNTCYAATQGVFRETDCITVSGDASGTVVRNNLMYTPQEPLARVLAGSGVIDSGDNTVAASNPFVVDNPVSATDFEPRAGGPASGAGSTHAGNLQDLFGRSRPLGQTDLGAVKQFPLTPPVAPILERN